MACGRPVIVSAAGGASELFRDGVDALGFKPGDVMGLARMIRKLIDDPAQSAELSKNARKTAILRFNRRRIGPAILEIYRTLVRAK
jgi:glycosyltransferase involved in cell wall biosynthesis